MFFINIMEFEIKGIPIKVLEQFKEILEKIGDKKVIDVKIKVIRDATRADFIEPLNKGEN